MHPGQSYQLIYMRGWFLLFSCGLSGVFNTCDHSHVFDFLAILLQGSFVDTDDFVDIEELKEAVGGGFGWYFGSAEDR